VPAEDQGRDPCDQDGPESIYGSLRYTNGVESEPKDKDAHFDLLGDLSEHVWKDRGRFLSAYVCESLAFRLLSGLRVSVSVPKGFFFPLGRFFFSSTNLAPEPKRNEPTDAGMSSVRGLVTKKPAEGH